MVLDLFIMSLLAVNIYLFSAHYLWKGKVLTGKIAVSGSNCISIPIKKHPQEITVDFEDDCEPAPCNPRHHDYLDWYVTKNHNKHYLVIEWDVANVRHIVWEVKF